MRARSLVYFQIIDWTYTTAVVGRQGYVVHHRFRMVDIPARHVAVG